MSNRKLGVPALLRGTVAALALAGAELLRRAGGVVEHALFVIDLHELGGAEALRAAGVEPWALMAFEGH